MPVVALIGEEIAEGCDATARDIFDREECEFRIAPYRRQRLRHRGGVCACDRGSKCDCSHFPQCGRLLTQTAECLSLETAGDVNEDRHRDQSEDGRHDQSELGAEGEAG